MKKDLEEILESRETETRRLMREVRKALDEWNGIMEGARDLGEQGRKDMDKKKNSGKVKVRRRRTEPVRSRGRRSGPW